MIPEKVKRCVTHHACECNQEFIKRSKDVLKEFRPLFQNGIDGYCVGCGHSVDGDTKHHSSVCKAMLAIEIMKEWGIE